VRQPILTNEDLEKIRTIGDIADNQFQTQTLDITFAAERGPDGMEMALERLCERAEQAVLDGYNIIILSDRLVGRAARADPGAAGHRRGPPSPDPQGSAAPPSASSWRPAKRARCTISAPWPATAPRRSTPISPSRPCST
jgi:hypothetical protein